jgi:hypothetical protein
MNTQNLTVDKSRDKCRSRVRNKYHYEIEKEPHKPLKTLGNICLVCAALFSSVKKITLNKNKTNLLSQVKRHYQLTKKRASLF